MVDSIYLNLNYREADYEDKDRKPDKVVVASNGIIINLYGQMDIEALARSI